MIPISDLVKVKNRYKTIYRKDQSVVYVTADMVVQWKARMPFGND
jgi:hypothetical protein